MKVKLKIIPLVGIEINNSRIFFGSDMDEIIKTLGEPDYKNDRQFYYDTLEFRMDFDTNKKLNFVELQGPDTERIIPEIYGVNPFELEADDLIALLKEKDDNIDASEKPYCYCFQKISIGVWRDVTPERVIQSIPKNIIGEEENIWQKELDKAKRFWTVGAGIDGYYKW
ncbi:hypothetical protein ACIRNY_01520 [Capnocytophaga canimorsus]|uniref:hypothetical protein n=1 Tax=Capnocytophaga canimorsus TaxID=28188 RepID=UPI00384CF923